MNIKVTWITNKIQKTHLQMVFSVGVVSSYIYYWEL